MHNQLLPPGKALQHTASSQGLQCSYTAHTPLSLAPLTGGSRSGSAPSAHPCCQSRRLLWSSRAPSLAPPPWLPLGLLGWAGGQWGAEGEGAVTLVLAEWVGGLQRSSRAAEKSGQRCVAAAGSAGGSGGGASGGAQQRPRRPAGLRARFKYNCKLLWSLAPPAAAPETPGDRRPVQRRRPRTLGVYTFASVSIDRPDQRLGAPSGACCGAQAACMHAFARLECPAHHRPAAFDARMLAHAAQVRALRACGVRRAPCRRAAAAGPHCQQQVAAPHPDIVEVLLQPQQIAGRVQEVGR